ncbi:MAG TPA: hypothetical protein PKD92_10450, partial [Novosphingobium sp.]|nr:hypothetical protein [Novosphingobium sp.]
SGDDDDDEIDGGDGDDLIAGGEGDDVLDGGDGHDTLDGGAGNDTVRGGLGADLLLGGDGDDLLSGGSGSDEIDGDDGADTMLGGAGNDVLSGGRDNDSLDGGDGDDLVFGEEGDDTILGGDGRDHLLGGDGNDVLAGGAGNDTLEGEAGHDALRGEDGDDLLLGADGDDSLEGGDGDDTLSGGNGNDSLHGGAGDDRIEGEDGDDLITGGDGDDTLSGGDGDDELDGGAGFNQLDGGAGNDTIRLVPFGSGHFLLLTISPYLPAGSVGPLNGANTQLRLDGRTADGSSFLDLAGNIERLLLGDGDDYVMVDRESISDRFRQAIVIDLGSGDDDTLHFAPLSIDSVLGNGIFYINGFVQSADQERTARYLETNVLYGLQGPMIGKLLQDEDLATPDDLVRFLGADTIILTDASDRFVLTARGADAHSGTGDIFAMGGDDIIFISSPPPGALKVDGGAGNDIIFVTGGSNVVVAGGLGRDVIHNSSPGGLLYGDTIDGLTVDADGRIVAVPDTPENADHFHFAPKTTIMDPQRNDILTFFGIPLTGGDASVTSVSWALAGPTSAYTNIIQTSMSAYALLGSVATGGLLRTYYDTFLPNVVYIISDNGKVADGKHEVLIFNQTDILFRIATGMALPDQFELGDVTTSVLGMQRIVNFEFKAGGLSVLGRLGRDRRGDRFGPPDRAQRDRFAGDDLQLPQCLLGDHGGGVLCPRSPSCDAHHRHLS